MPCLPTWSSIWINGGTSFSALPLLSGVSREQHTLHLGKARLFQNMYFAKRAGMEKPLSDDEPREFRAVMDGWRSPCRVREEERAALGVCPCGTGGAGTAGPGPACAAGPPGSRRVRLPPPPAARGSASPSAPGAPARLAEAAAGAARLPARWGGRMGAGAAAPLPAGSPPRRALPRAPAASLPFLPPPRPRLRIAAAGAHAARPRMLRAFVPPPQVGPGRRGRAGPGPGGGRRGGGGAGAAAAGPGEAANKSAVQNGASGEGLDPRPPRRASPRPAAGAPGRRHRLRCRRRGVGRERGWSGGRRGALSRAWGRRGAAEVAARGRGGSVKHFPLLSVSLWEDSRPDSVEVPLPLPPAPHPSSARQPTQEGIGISPLRCAGEVADMPAAGSRCSGSGGEPDLKGNCAADNAQQQHLEQPWGLELRF